MNVTQEISKNVVYTNKLYTVFSDIPLDIVGSNIACTGWLPTESDKKYMDDDSFAKAVKEGKEKNATVLFKNVSLNWE